MGIGRFVIKMLGQRVERGEPMHGRGVVTTAVVVRIEAVHLYKFQFTIFVRLFVGTIAFVVGKSVGIILHTLMHFDEPDGGQDYICR